MKRVFFLIIFFIVTSFVLPTLIFLTAKTNPKEKNENEKTVNVLFTKENVVKKMPLEEYLTGVLAAEMPASFEIEALKAQAVAARSYAIYKQNKGGITHSQNADVCTDFSHCKAYKSMEEAKKGWGKDSQKYEEKIKKAIDETKGEILTYEGDVAMAVFHSQTGGNKTESSKDVWGGEVPYLINVESGGEIGAPNFYSSKEISFDEFKNVLNEKGAEINNPDDIKDIKKSEGGAVKEITIGKKTFKGSEVRTLFGLRSACFKIDIQNNTVFFEVLGYGHGVGMSQYGANELAKKGQSYRDILLHYYTGTKLDYMNV